MMNSKLEGLYLLDEERCWRTSKQNWMIQNEPRSEGRTPEVGEGQEVRKGAASSESLTSPYQSAPRTAPWSVTDRAFPSCLVGYSLFTWIPFSFLWLPALVHIVVSGSPSKYGFASALTESHHQETHQLLQSIFAFHIWNSSSIPPFLCVSSSWPAQINLLEGE